MSPSRWLRKNAEHYLMVAAQDRVARRYGVTRPRRPTGLEQLFWLRLFAPLYARLPWSVRSRALRLMPGSHRKQWTSWTDPPRRRDPAV